ncbi:hypothetical protein COU58_02780 [Candidatus Pacearchaeota archaeon CG10_big_fil_rev_8_21_14_0_10_32_42]|nr:MAG: hypothetical protein COU58_02780 [Candidatus Pacearchaeota archaeon CG10_big_fil_rev_8_21_14_0_10_32_42]
MKIASFFLIFFLLASVNAFQINGTNVSCEDLKIYSSSILGEKIPSSVPYQNEIFNFYFENESLGNLEINEGVLSNFSCEKNENATYDIKVNNEKLFENFDSNLSAIKILNQKLSSNEINIDGRTFGKKFKWFFTKFALKVVGWF